VVPRRPRPAGQALSKQSFAATTNGAEAVVRSNGALWALSGRFEAGTGHREWDGVGRPSANCCRSSFLQTRHLSGRSAFTTCRPSHESNSAGVACLNRSYLRRLEGSGPADFPAGPTPSPRKVEQRSACTQGKTRIGPGGAGRSTPVLLRTHLVASLRPVFDRRPGIVRQIIDHDHQCAPHGNHVGCRQSIEGNGIDFLGQRN